MAQEIFIPKLADKVLMKCMSEVSVLIPIKDLRITYVCQGQLSISVSPEKY